MPFRKIIQAYRETKASLSDISKELTEQRTSSLDMLQRQGDKQVELLGKTVEVLQEMHTDSKLMLEHLRDRQG
jgi:predicted CopG family antitoxin